MKKIIKASALVDVDKGKLVPEAVVVVEKGKIELVESGYDPVLCENDELIDLGDNYLLPGLINSHAHACFITDGRPFEEQLKMPHKVMMLVAEKNIYKALQSGVTTIRDCGDGHGVMYALRDAIEMGLIEGPRLFVSGEPLTVTGGHCHQLGGEVDGIDEIIKSIRQHFKGGADFIKLMGTGGGTPGTYPAFSSFSYEELKIAAEEAHRIDKTITAHVRGTPGIKQGVEAGLDHLEHVSFQNPDGHLYYDREVGNKIAEKGIYVTPTIQLFRDYFEETVRQKEAGNNSKEIMDQIDLFSRLWDTKLEIVHQMLRDGVKMTAGNDAGLPLTGFGYLWRELDAMVLAGMTPIQAIIAATKTAAEAMKIDNQIGSLTKGLAADIIAVKDNPIDDIKALSHVTFIMSNGEVRYG